GGGKSMRNLLLAYAVAAFAALPAFAEEACMLNRIAVIPFETDETGHIYVPTVIGGHSTRLMLDTGGYWSSINEDLAKAMNLEVETSREWWLVDSSGEKLDRYVSVPEMKLGGITYSVPIDFFLERLPNNRAPEKFGGSLGLNFIARLDLEIDNA